MVCRQDEAWVEGKGISKKWPSGLGLGGGWIQNPGVGENFSL